MADWTYGTDFDLTNGGSNDLTIAPLLSGLSGVTDLRLLLNLFSTNTANEGPVIQLGDAGGVETTGYVGETTIGAGAPYPAANGFFTFTDGYHDAVAESRGITEIWRFHPDQHLWLSRGWNFNSQYTTYLHMAMGRKELSADLTQLQITTQLGAAVFDNGDARAMYATLPWTYGPAIDLSLYGDTAGLISQMPSGVTEVNVMMYGYSCSTNNNKAFIQLGDIDGFKETGYESAGIIDTTADGLETVGFSWSYEIGNDAARLFHLMMRLTKFDDSTDHMWLCESVSFGEAYTLCYHVGFVTLDNALKQIRLTHNTVSTLDAGQGVVRYR